MKLTVYWCTSGVCQVIRDGGHIAHVCLVHAIELHELPSGELSSEHRDLLAQRNVQSFPAFVVEDGLDVQAFGADGWSAFERKLRGNIG